MATAKLVSVHVITSDLTRAPRARLVQELEARLTKAGGLCDAISKVETHECDELRNRLQELQGDEKATGALLDLNAEHMDDSNMRPALAPLHIRSLSNLMKHYQAILDAASRGVDAAGPPKAPEAPKVRRWALILEDDAMFNAETLEGAIRRTMESAPDDADLVFLGLPSTRKPDLDGRIVFDDLNEHVKVQMLPACDSYLVSLDAIEKLAQNFLPARFITNLQLTWLLRNKNLRAYSAVPNVFVDGSKLGGFTSSLTPNNHLIWNHVYCQLSVHMDSGRRAEFEALWDQQDGSFKNHPDCIALRARWLAACDRPEEARDQFEKALNVYDLNGCVVGINSEFMKHYMRVFAKLQTQTTKTT